MAGIYDERILGAKQQAETARKLREGMTSPQGQMVSGWYVAPSITQHLANALKTYTTTKQEREAMSEYERLRKQKEQETADIYAQMQSRPQSVLSDEGPQQPFREPTERERMSALLRGVSVNPEAFNPQLQMAQYEMSQADKERARKEQMQFQREMQQERLQAQQEMARQASADRRSLAALAQSNRRGDDRIGWKYDAGSDMWVAPPSAQYPQGIATAPAARLKSAENFGYLANKMVGTEKTPGVVYKTTTGGWMGLGGQIGKVTNSQQQKEFNNLKEQMSTELRTIFRIPGEGALSDKEQAQYGVQLPDIGNDPALNASIIRDLQYRIQNKTTPGANPLTPSAPRGSGNVIRYDAQGNRVQ